jgi:hypothetical protein
VGEVDVAVLRQRLSICAGLSRHSIVLATIVVHFFGSLDVASLSGLALPLGSSHAAPAQFSGLKLFRLLILSSILIAEHTNLPPSKKQGKGEW